MEKYYNIYYKNFYIRNFIRALKETNLYNKNKLPDELKYIFFEICNNDLCSLPHTLSLHLGFCNSDYEKFNKSYYNLIKEQYINDIIKLIKSYKQYKKIDIDEETLNERIKENRLISYLNSKFKISSNNIITKKYEIFFKEFKMKL